MDLEHIVVSSCDFKLKPYHFSIVPGITLDKQIAMCNYEPTRGVPPDNEKLKKLMETVGRLINRDPGDYKSLAFFGIYDDVSYKYIAEVLPKPIQVTRLVLDGTYTDVGVNAICEAVKGSTVKKIHFGGITEKAVDAVLSHIADDTLKLDHLAFWDAKVGRDVYERLFRVMQHNDTIEELWFPKSELHTLPREWIEECFSENSTLTKINPEIFDLIKPLQWFADRNRICKQKGVSKEYKNSIPQELEKDEDMVKFLEDLVNSSEELRAMKLVVMGDGRIGKTTLLSVMKSLLDPASEKNLDPKSTVGVACGTLKIAKGEISVWDFAGQMEYTATHSFFLSMEMTSMLVCFNLGVPATEQKRQITFWLDFLNSSLALPPLPSSTTVVPKWNIILVGVRADEQKDFTLTTNQNLINIWKKNWPRLPILPKLFIVSSLDKTETRVEQLLAFVDAECARILDQHTVRIPSAYHKVLTTIHNLSKTDPYIHKDNLHAKFGEDILKLRTSFQTMLQYFHSIGRIVLLPTGFVFTDPTLAPQIAAKFVSPIDVRIMLLKEDTEQVQILTKESVGCLLDIDVSNNERLKHELELMLHLKICFELRTADTTSLLYLFPSLSSEEPITQFALPNDPEHKKVTGIRFVAPEGVIFVQGFFCQLLVQLFTSLNIYRDDIKTVCMNGAIILCPGLFEGELLVVLNTARKHIVIAMNASDPDTNYAVSVFKELIRTRTFSQYAESRQDTLCPDCIKLYFFEGKIRLEEIGYFRENCAVCSSPKQHPRPVENAETVGFTKGEKCKAHKSDQHHIFLNYRVRTEGKKAPYSFAEAEGGAIERLFKPLAVKKTKYGKQVYVFWDGKCLNDGQNWEVGFMRGIKFSQVIVLLMSNSVMKGIIESADHGSQDNVLIEYEAAVLLNKRYGVPVFPIFLAEITADKAFDPFIFKHDFPDKPHQRSDYPNRFIAHLSYGLAPEDTKFLGSVKHTMAEVFKHQGHFMSERMESEKQLTELVGKITDMLEVAPPVNINQRGSLAQSPIEAPRDERRGDRREGDRREGDRREGDRREGDRREGERREGERREGERREGERREGERTEGERREGEQVAKEQAAKQQTEKKEKEKAAEKAAKERAEKAAKEQEEKAAKEREEKAAKEQAEKAAKVQEEKAAKEREEKAAKEREEKAAKEREEKAAKEQAEKAAKAQEEKAAKEREEKAAKEREEKAAKEREENAAKEREEKAAKVQEKATKEREEKVAKQQEEKLAKAQLEKAAKEKEEKVAKERAEKAQAEREEKERALKEQAEKEAKEQADKERAEKEAKEKEEKQAIEQQEQQAARAKEKVDKAIVKQKPAERNNEETITSPAPQNWQLLVASTVVLVIGLAFVLHFVRRR